MNLKDIKFEDAMKKLEGIVSQLEDNTGDLDEVIKLYNEGIELVGFCKKKIDKVEAEVELLTKKMSGNFSDLTEKNNEE